MARVAPVLLRIVLLLTLTGAVVFVLATTVHVDFGGWHVGALLVIARLAYGVVRF